MQPGPVENRFLAALPCEIRQRILPSMQTVQLRRKQPIHRPGEAIGSVYFPVTAVLSLVSILEDGSSTEVGAIGNEGLAGLPALLGAESTPFDMVVQVPGAAHRMLAHTLGEEVRRSPPLREALLRFEQAFLDQVAQTAACGRHHVVGRRLATWLLMMSDRVESDQVPLTHESLADTLGVGRPSVTLAAAALQSRGLIRYSRGVITVLDRPGLEAHACECYRIIHDEYDRLLG